MKCRYEFQIYKEHWVCFHCRKMFRQILREPEQVSISKSSRRGSKHISASIAKPVIVCPECKQPMVDLGHDFKAPPKNDIKQWKKVKLLYLHGYTWHTCGCYSIPEAKTLKGAREYIKQKKQEHQRALKRMQRYEKRAKSKKHPKYKLSALSLGVGAFYNDSLIPKWNNKDEV